MPEVFLIFGIAYALWSGRLLQGVRCVAVFVPVIVLLFIVLSVIPKPWLPDPVVRQLQWSPDEKHVAVLETYIAGPAAGVCNDDVIVRRVADEEEEVAAESFLCSEIVRIDWVDSDNLVVTHTSPKSRVAENLDLGVAISYQRGEWPDTSNSD